MLNQTRVTDYIDRFFRMLVFMLGQSFYTRKKRLLHRRYQGGYTPILQRWQ